MAAFKDWLEKNSVSKQLKDIQASIASLQKEIEKLKESSGKDVEEEEKGLFIFNEEALFKRVRLCPTTVLKNTMIDRNLNINVRVGLSLVDNSFAHKNINKKHLMSLKDQGVEGEGFTHCLSNSNTLTLTA